jgi:hypothetical protein
MIQIPMRALPESVSVVTFEVEPYRLTVKWNTRGAYYTLDVATREGVELVSGIKVALNAALFRRYPAQSLAPGELLVLDPSGEESVILFDDVEGRVALIYVTEEEYAAI